MCRSTGEAEDPRGEQLRAGDRHWGGEGPRGDVVLTEVSLESRESMEKDLLVVV